MSETERQVASALQEIDRWLDGMNTVSAEWAPAHSAPYVSKVIIRPGIEAILNRHLAAGASPALAVHRRRLALRTALIQHWEANPHHECHAICADDIFARVRERPA